MYVYQQLFANQQMKLPGHYREWIEQCPAAFVSDRPIRQWQEHCPTSLHQLLANFCSSRETELSVVYADSTAARH